MNLNHDLTARQNLAKRIDDARNKRGFTLTQLADKAGCSEKTIRKILKGERARGRSVAEICAALEMSIEDFTQDTISDQIYGGYTLSNFGEYVGHFYAYRRSLTYPNILRSAFDISWDKERRCLQFQEYQRYHSAELHTVVDHSQFGELYFSATIGLIHFVTCHKGAFRLITVSKFRLNDPSDFTMQGIVLTQARRAFHYQPCAAAIVLEKIKTLPLPQLKASVEAIRPGTEEYKVSNEKLTNVERHVANFALTPPPQDALHPAGPAGI